MFAQDFVSHVFDARQDRIAADLRPPLFREFVRGNFRGTLIRAIRGIGHHILADQISYSKQRMLPIIRAERFFWNYFSWFRCGWSRLCTLPDMGSLCQVPGRRILPGGHLNSHNIQAGGG